MFLDTLILENCNLDNFQPTGLGALRVLSLAGNQIPNLSSFILCKEDLNPNETGRRAIADVALEELDLSDNHLEAFPWAALHKMTMIKRIRLGRNRITTILDDADRQIYRLVSRSKKNMQPFQVFKELQYLDLSSNQFTTFPEELNALAKLKELNLMNN